MPPAEVFSAQRNPATFLKDVAGLKQTGVASGFFGHGHRLLSLYRSKGMAH